jgi:hypothetical protein
MFGTCSRTGRSNGRTRFETVETLTEDFLVAVRAIQAEGGA